MADGYTDKGNRPFATLHRRVIIVFSVLWIKMTKREIFKDSHKNVYVCMYFVCKHVDRRGFSGKGKNKVPESAPREWMLSRG